MTMPRFSFIFLLFGVSACLQITSAKRGCSAFGHSCYGGHGKRSGEGQLSVVDSEFLRRLMVARREGGESEVPQPTYLGRGGLDDVPHATYPGKVLQEGDNIIPIRDGGLFNHGEGAEVFRELMKFRLQNLFKNWLSDYRRDPPHADEPRFQDNVAVL